MACDKNPFEAYLIKIFNYMNNNPSAFLNEVMTSGFTGSTSVYCCPDCSEVSIVCSNVRFWRYYPLVCLDETCCVNYSANISDYSALTSSGVPIENQCCDGFNDCVTGRLVDVIGCNPIETGIIEYSTIQDSTSLCIIADVLSQYDQTTALSYFTQLMDFGLVIYCDCGNVYGTTLDGYFYAACCHKCAFFNMVESPEFINGILECGTEPGRTGTTISIDSFVVNGTQQITTPFTIDLDDNSVNWISANNNIVSGCTSGSVTGITYTNVVDMLNNMFTTLGLTEYSAQIALDTNAFIPTSNSQCGFYLMWPKADTFEIKINSSIGFTMYYTNCGLFCFGLTDYYYQSTFDGFNYDCETNTVIESHMYL